MNRRKVIRLVSELFASSWAMGVMRRPLYSLELGTDILAVPNDTLAKSLPFDLLPDTVLRATGRQVFAHWHVFPISMDNLPSSQDYYALHYTNPEGENGRYKNFGGYIRERPVPRPPRPQRDWAISDMVEEVRQAAAIGIDAFAFNIVTIDPKHSLWQQLPNMLEATVRSGERFKIIPNLDAVALMDLPTNDIVDALRSIAAHKAIMRTPDNRMVLGSFYAEGWPVVRWRALFDGLAGRGIKVAFIAVFLSYRNASADHVALADMVSLWTGDHIGSLLTSEFSAFAARLSHKRWMAPIWPQDFRPKDGWYAEASNSLLFRKGWRSAIKTKADCVQLITWNDYSESSEIRPSTGIQYSFYDLAAYYITWYKSGKKPEIVRDVLYYFHRIEPTTGGAFVNQQAPFNIHYGDRPTNEIELLGFLRLPGRLEIEIGGRIVGVDAPAGLTSVRAPLANGRPLFRLKRNGREIIAMESAFEIRTTSRYRDLLYRGGSSSRPPVQGLALGSI